MGTLQASLARDQWRIFPAPCGRFLAQEKILMTHSLSACGHGAIEIALGGLAQPKGNSLWR